MSTNYHSKSTKFWEFYDKDPDHDTQHEVIFDNVQSIQTITGWRRQMDLYHACLYGDADFGGMDSAGFNAEYVPGTLAFNVVRQCVDTLTAKIAKNQPAPTPATRNGSFKQRRRAKKLEYAFIGQFEASKVWETSPSIARDAALFGTGITHNFRVDKTICHERVLPWELIINPREARYGAPRTIYFRRWVDRGVLVELYPEFEDQINGCTSSPMVADIDPSYDDNSDQVLVVEAWHKPSRVLTKKSDKKHDGRHTIAINGTTLFTEEWRHQYFPFTFLRMTDPVWGFFGTGLAYTLSGLQYTINDTAAVIQDAHALTGGYIMVENGSNLETDKLDNSRGSILKYDGTPPQWINPAPVNPMTMDFLMQMIPMANQMSGVSQLSAQSMKPAGIDSAIAMTTYNDIETERFAMFGQQYEQYHIDVAWQFFDLWNEIHDEYPDFTVLGSKYPGSSYAKDFEFDKIKLDREGFVLQCFPTAMLSKKITGRLNEVQNLMNMGWISKEDAMPLMQMPDTDAYYNLQAAAMRVIEDCVETMLDAEDPSDPDAFLPPEPEFNLKLCAVLGQVMWLDAKLNGCPPENLSLVSDWLEQCRIMMEPPPAPPPPPGMGADPNQPQVPMPEGMVPEEQNMPSAGMPPGPMPGSPGQPMMGEAPDGMGARNDMIDPNTGEPPPEMM